MARFAAIRVRDISDGPGIRIGVYFQGCPYHCKGCWNEETWDETGGLSWTKEKEDQIIKEAQDENVVGLSLLGGEPLYRPSYRAALRLIKRFKKTYPDKTIWIWSGNVFEKMSETYLEALKWCDVLVDGPFILEQQDTTLPYSGSTNQRVIDLKETFEKGEVVLWQD